MTTVDSKQLNKLWNQLQTEWNDIETKCIENSHFENSFLMDKIKNLSNCATLKPLIARDLMNNHNDFSPKSTENIWDIEFDRDWQNNDRNDKFNKWCKKIHRYPEYQDLMHRLQSALTHWSLILNIDDNDNEFISSWFRPPHFPSTLSLVNNNINNISLHLLTYNNLNNNK